MTTATPVEVPVETGRSGANRPRPVQPKKTLPGRTDAPRPSQPPLVVPTLSSAPAGLFDVGFGEQGVVDFARRGRADRFLEQLQAVAIDARGSVFVLGQYGGVARLTPEGRLDPSYGDGGYSALDPDVLNATSFVLLPDGKVALTGFGYEYPAGPRPDSAPDGLLSWPALARLNADGTHDTGFGQEGFSFAGVSSETMVYFHGVTALSDGTLVGVGERSYRNVYVADSNDAAIVRVLPDGTPDPGFYAPPGTTFYDASPDVAKRTDESTYAVLAGPGDTVYAVGYGTNPATAGNGLVEDDDCLVLRYLPDGRLDPAFGQGGAVYLEVPSEGPAPLQNGCTRAALDTRGRLVVGEWGTYVDGDSASDLFLARLLPDGTPDPSFGQGGVARIDVTTYDTLTGFVTLPDESIMIVGDGGVLPAGSGFPQNWGQIVHVLADGTLDPSFGEGGAVRLDTERNATATPSYDEEVFDWVSLKSIARQPDGKLVVGGDLRTTEGYYFPVAVRLSIP